MTIKPCIKCGATDRRKSGRCRACAMKYYAANSEKAKAAISAWHAANPEKVRAYKVAWYAANSEKENARAAAFRAANPEKVKTSNAVWRAANPEKKRLCNQNRRARKRNAEGTHTVEDIKELIILQKGKCTCCKTSIKDSYHVDHIMPLVKGGSNDRYNLQLLCPTCNLRKNAKHPVDFMQSKGFLL